MKKYLIPPLMTGLLMSSLLLPGCDLSNPAVSPDACLQILQKTGTDYTEVTEARVNQEVYLRSCSPADYMVVWPGDLTRDYYNKAYVDPVTPLKPDGTPNLRYGSGIVINKTVGQIAYKYTKPGTYQVALLSTNVGDDLEGKRAEVIKTITITE
jgi:hypothetical protein